MKLTYKATHLRTRIHTVLFRLYAQGVGVTGAREESGKIYQQSLLDSLDFTIVTHPLLDFMIATITLQPLWLGKKRLGVGSTSYRCERLGWAGSISNDPNSRRRVHCNHRLQ